ncbi:MAG: ATP-binding protein [Bacilli bacterium]|nr:ATP-binding protein [Bacilli bacterium]
MIGSGKTTLADKYRDNNNYIVISLDCLYRGQDKENMNEDTSRINRILQKKFPNQNNERYF